MTVRPSDPSTSLPEPPPGAKIVAAIDIGSNAIRMVIAEVYGDGRIEPLERLHRAVRLGQDTFRRGRLGGQSMRAALAVLKDFQKLLQLFRVEMVRAVATSAVREASNADVFLDRIFIATGLQVEVIDTSEESRLTVSAVRQALGGVVGDGQGETLIADVGGGSTLLTLLQGAEIITSQSLRLGAIRLQESLATAEEPPQVSAELLRSHIGNVISVVQGSLPVDAASTFVAVGGDARFVARQVGKSAESSELTTVDNADFDRLVEKCVRFTAEDLSRRHGLPFADAETLIPALLVYHALLHRTRAAQMIVSHASMRDGLLLELAQHVTGKQDDSLLAGIIHSAVTLGEKYHADPVHGENVADLSVRLFDALHADHGLGPRYRLLLRIAALLHEIGGYVSNRSHHKHSEYLIANSEIFGLGRAEIAVVAQIARYHRRSGPRAAHSAYMALPRESRVVVNKLAAILRVADALARGPARKMRELRIEREGDELVLTVRGPVDLILERHALAAKGDLFDEVYGMKVRLEEE